MHRAGRRRFAQTSNARLANGGIPMKDEDYRRWVR